jgi:hypothetical protein
VDERKREAGALAAVEPGSYSIKIAISSFDKSLRLIKAMA